MTDSYHTETVGPDAGPPDGFPEGPPTLRPGSRIADRYTVGRVLGSGGYAVVYLAHDELLERDVAVKVLRADRFTPAARLRLRREATAARDVAHPNLIRIFDFGLDGELAFLIMEVVDGTTLRGRLAGGALPVEEATHIAGEALRALGALHAAGLVHRDVKPGNLLLTADGTAKLGDFGLVRNWQRDETRATSAEAMVGTLEYLSPEQAVGGEVDGRSDLYSLGVVLFELLTGHLPYPSESSLATVLAHLNEPAPDVRALRPETPRWLAAIVARLLEKDPVARYATAEAVLADLESRRAPERRRVRWSRRRVLAAAAALAVAMTLGLVALRRLAPSAPRFNAVVADGDRAVRAVDAQGHTLWRRENVQYAWNFLPVHRGTDRHLELAALLGSADAYDAATRSVLSFVDPTTGRTVDEFRLPNAATSFRGMADQYSHGLAALDIDGDGREEVFVSYWHVNAWPSYTVLFEPGLSRSRVLFVGAGHHHVRAVQDLDGDGRAEVLLGGIANRMGWYNGLAAVAVDPWIGTPSTPDGLSVAAMTPDGTVASGESRTLLWYALLPAGYLAQPGEPMTIDPVRREIDVRYANGRSVALDFTGFAADGLAHPPAAERQAVRRRAQAALREATRLTALDRPADAVASGNEARAAAAAAGDAVLAEWAGQVTASALARAGRADEAERLFDDVVRGAATPADIAFTAGRAFHLVHALDRAAAWYRRGLALAAGGEGGRNRWELIEGEVLALGELGRWREAATEAGRALGAYPGNPISAIYRNYAAWRAGDPPVVPTLPTDVGWPDLPRAWVLELRLAAGEDPANLLAAAQAQLGQTSEVKPLLLSVESEALRRLGRTAEAAAKAAEALGAVRSEPAENLSVRADLPLLAERAAQAGGR